MQEFWVQGGRYMDRQSERLASGAALESYGPFYSYHDARHEWQARTLGAVAKPTVRYRIVAMRAVPGELAFAAL